MNQQLLRHSVVHVSKGMVLAHVVVYNVISFSIFPLLKWGKCNVGLLFLCCKAVLFSTNHCCYRCAYCENVKTTGCCCCGLRPGFTFSALSDSQALDVALGSADTDIS